MTNTPSAIDLEKIEHEMGMFQLFDVTASVPEGKMTAIIGPNGSGKSTLLKIVAKLLKADKGDVSVQGKAAGVYSRADYARTISMLPQAKEMLPELTVRELIAFGRSPHKGMFKQRLTDEDNKIIDWAMKTMSIRRHDDRMFHTLSGGEQQKARIAMALAQKTSIILLDEPTTFLDISHQLEVMGMLRKINQEQGITIVMVLHDLQQAAAFCDHLIAMKDGEIVSTGNPQAVITSRFLRQVYEIEAKVSFEQNYPVIIPIPRNYEEDATMIIVTNISQITKGNGDKLIERFDRIGKVEGMEGFLGLEVLLTQNTKDYDEVSVVTRWNSKDDFQAWTKSEAFRESHTHRKTPDYIISNKITFQEVKVKRNPLPPIQQELAKEA
ncbi:heme oxygenase (staphylobilin-producing) [Paenibacillus endophyticus]|uniref:Heme oxygenase (Staphylobilin-producing) n=1 Tax=Paenibacillus endophyticus TaxID=1294268 RepID=A0A7W5C7A3_9BACL|nr:heme oxygenase [Paenibacillus endophyticus]MBB3152443.1 heme oxygenase (staphylobilin-producing) [Paenibacillus endophyticus]